MRKLYPIFLSFLLVYFSFYYTNKVIDIVRSKDKIMLQIKKEKSKYEQKAQSAQIIDNKIVPGKNGKKVNEIKSFSKMKQYGKYNDSLYVFDEVEPDISIDSYYDKYIEKGRNDENKVAIVFHIDRFDNIEDVIEILKNNNTKATFFMDGLFIENNSNSIKNMKNSGHELELLNYNGSYDKMYFEKGLHSLFNITKEEPRYCYAEYDNKKVLELCNSLGLHTIIPSINTNNNSFNIIKNKLDSGSIISLKNSSINLNTIINYIKQRGYKLVTLNELLLEDIEK